jgi:hypothetical protein
MLHGQGWQWIELLVTAKAYPSVSVKYGEAVCVAGVRLDTDEPEWIRLYPVRFRDLPLEQRFRKYQVIRLRAKKHSGDARSETWRPDVGSIQPGKFIRAGGAWEARRDLVEALIGPTMCQLHKGRKRGGDGPSLGIVRPLRVRSIRVSAEEAWSSGQQGTVGQGNLLTTKTDLVKPGHAFAYSYLCEEPGCRGHVQKIVDWELGEAYRHWEYSTDELICRIKRRWQDDMFSERRESFLFVGDQHRRPGQFLVLGTFSPEWRPNADQMVLAFAQQH